MPAGIGKLLVTVFALAAFATGSIAPAAPPEEVDSGSLRPQWQVGDQWVIETVTDTVQVRSKDAQRQTATVRWEFTVSRIEPIGGRDCYRIDIRCLTKGRIRPKTTIWCDTKTLFLRQLRTQLMAAGEYRTVEESFKAGSGGYAPVLPSMNALPLDLPAFLPPGSKATQFTVESLPAAVGSKDASLFNFSSQVRQHVGRANAKSLSDLPQSFSKSLEDRPIAEVRLGDEFRTVKQLWEPGKPWPIYSHNGRTQARLVRVEKAKASP